MRIAVISGKGGSGKSSVTAAWVSLASHAIAVDCDVDASNLPLLFPHHITHEEAFVSGMELCIDTEACIGCGLCAAHCAYQAISMLPNGKATAHHLLCEGCGLCADLCPQHAITLKDMANSSIYTATSDKGTLVYGHLYPGDDNSGKMIARLREIADERMEAEHTSLQILDGPPGIGCPVLSTITGIDRCVIVSEPTQSGIADLRRIYKVALSFCEDIMVVINKCDIHPHNTRLIHAFCNEQDIPVIAEVPFDRRLVEAQVHCQSIVDYAPECEASEVLTQAFACATKQ